MASATEKSGVVELSVMARATPMRSKPMKRKSRPRPGATNPAATNGSTRQVNSREGGTVATASAQMKTAVKVTETSVAATGRAWSRPRRRSTLARPKPKAEIRARNGGQVTGLDCTAGSPHRGRARR